jgi:hypothetical protein
MTGYIIYARDYYGEVTPIRTNFKNDIEGFDNALADFCECTEIADGEIKIFRGTYSNGNLVGRTSTITINDKG